MGAVTQFQFFAGPRITGSGITSTDVGQGKQLSALLILFKQFNRPDQDNCALKLDK
jgi:hypothetical protein